MVDFVQKLNITTDSNIFRNHLSEILINHTEWGDENQIGIRHRIGCDNVWKDAIGGLFDRTTMTQLSYERDFNQWCSPEYKDVVSELEKLCIHENITLGRVRYMQLLPKRGLSMHYDSEHRYHLVLETNKDSIIAESFSHPHTSLRSIGYHIPVDNFWYKVETTREHFVYNGGHSPRIHLVVCPS